MRSKRFLCLKQGDELVFVSRVTFSHKHTVKEYNLSDKQRPLLGRICNFSRGGKFI